MCTLVSAQKEREIRVSLQVDHNESARPLENGSYDIVQSIYEIL